MAEPVRPPACRRARLLALAAWVGLLAACQSLPSGDEGFAIEVTDSTIYTTPAANNGAGPLWGFNNSNIARIGDTVWVSGLNTVAGLPPLNNTECKLWKKTGDAPWRQVLTLPGLTREPCPLGVLKGERLLISTNTTLNPPGKSGGGPARPGLWEAIPAEGFAHATISQPDWRAQAGPFSEHSYRSLAVDGPRGEVFILQNVGNSHAEWAFRDASGAWPAQGRLDWPVKEINGRAMPLRVCYVVALVKDRAVHLLGVSDVVEPNAKWREYKRQLTGKSWDYVFRNLYYAWTPDVVREPFRPWLEVASQEQAAGGVEPGDLWMDNHGELHMVWTEAALDIRLQKHFFPDKKQKRSLVYASARGGEIVRKTDLVVSQEGQSNDAAHSPRFHISENGDMYVFFYVNAMEGAKRRVFENRIGKLRDGKFEKILRVPMELPFNHYIVSAGRMGGVASGFLDILGTHAGEEATVNYVRLRILSGDHQ